MSKNITSLLSRGNLTPKERILLLIQSDVIKDTTGKEPLTEADKKALLNWKAKTNEEAREWNKFSEGSKLFARLALEAELFFLQTKADYYKTFFITTQLIYYPVYKRIDKMLATLEKIKVVDINEAKTIAEKQREQKLKDGEGFDYAVYRLAFESLPEDMRADFKKLFDEVETEPDYLHEQEVFASLLDGKETLTPENKEKLAELVANKSYNHFAKEYQLWHYYADIPIREVAERFLASKGIDTKKIDGDERQLREILLDYARDNKTTIQELLKETVIKWLEEGFDYRPLVISHEKKTLSGEDTTYPHDELFTAWLKAKAQAKETLEKLITKGELQVRERTPEETRQDTRITGNTREDLEKKLLGERAIKSHTIITGDSLYAFTGDYKFVKKFKESVDTYNPGLGIVYADDDHEHTKGNIDRELLVAEKNSKGGLMIFSHYGIAIEELRKNFEATKFIKETEQDGEVRLGFSDESFEKRFKETREALTKCYAKELAVLEIFKRLSKTYQTDLTYLIKDRVESVSNFIDTHNNAIKTATGLHGGEFADRIDEFIWGKIKDVKMKDDLRIDKDKIQPDAEIRDEWSEKFEELLGDDY